MSSLTALSPLDGRYAPQLTDVAEIFSEFGLIRLRVMVEMKYLQFLVAQGCIPMAEDESQSALTSNAHRKDNTKKETTLLQQVLNNFNLEQAETIKQIEARTKHDVKAVEYFLQEELAKLGSSLSSAVHVALTSEDTNSLAQALMLRTAQVQIIIPTLEKILQYLTDVARTYASVPMLARTHGQPAVPTTLGKEFAVFASRLFEELQLLTAMPIEGKLMGAVGNLNAHMVAFPAHNWLELSQTFVTSLGLTPQLITTQIIPAENATRLFSSLARVNSILLDLNQDLWRYISDNYLLQKKEEGQVGSSTMPQKINPIDFENSEGNLGLANSMFTYFIQKLPISRLQRDLSDSTVKRSIGCAIGYSQLAYRSLLKGLGKLSVNKEKLQQDLDEHWEVLAEAVQVVLRAHGDEEGYEKLRLFTQGKTLTQKDFQQFIQTLSLPSPVKQRLSALTPTTYIGAAEQLTQGLVQEISAYLKKR